MLRRPTIERSSHRPRSWDHVGVGMKRRVGLGSVLAIAVTIVVVAAACTSDDGNPMASPSTSFTLPPIENIGPVPGVTLPEGFVLVDARGARLLPFESDPKTTLPPLPVFGGTARISGRVTGPEGPVEGANVQIERLVGDQVGVANVRTARDGTYEAKDIHGGRYRVRAWLPPTLTTTTSQVAFLADDAGSADLPIELTAFEGKQVRVGLDLTAVNVGDSARVRALVTNQTVDDRGIVVGLPIPGAKVRLNTNGGFSIENAESTTDSSGLATWKVTCTKEGVSSFTADTEGASGSFSSPNCGPKPTTTTTSDLDVPAFPVGEEFDVPYKGVLPKGRYETFLDDCSTTFEVYLDGKWQPDRRTASDSVMTLPGPGRDFKAASGTKGCSYRRIT